MPRPLSPAAPLEPSSAAPDPLFNQSLEKGLAVLRAFDAAHRTMTLSELAEQTGMSKGSAQRTVHTLQVLGYVGKHPRMRRFQLLPKAMEIGANYLVGHPLVQVVHPYLAQLANASGETAHVTEPVGHDMLYLAQLVTSKFIPVFTPVGMRIPMYCSSSGRAYLSALPEGEARALLTAAHRTARTQFTLTDVDAILARIAECRQVGYATNSEELFLGDMGLAAPLVDRQGNAVGALHLSPPTSRWTMEEAQRKLGPMLIECARAISSTIAF
jgi:IclR family pca regulon transcriptional regulator